MTRFPFSSLRPQRPARILAAAALALAGGALPAFAAVPRVVSDEIDPVSRVPFTVASGRAEQPVSVQGNPFTTPGFADAVTRIMTQAFGGGRTRFVPVAAPTAESGPARMPNYSLVFNPAHGLLPDALCSGGPVATEPGRGPIVVRAATCLDGQAQSAVTGYLDQAAGPDDPGFTGLVRDLTQRLMDL
ncbi:hypothetical protein [Inquilinus sp. CA228]|uniref:hypothetical protein n=1 Tax=Inquilinus sp. CA228 TaxID=3455609 RepID=UPI003F8D05FA